MTNTNVTGVIFHLVCLFFLQVGGRVPRDSRRMLRFDDIKNAGRSQASFLLDFER